MAELVAEVVREAGCEVVRRVVRGEEEVDEDGVAEDVARDWVVVGLIFACITKLLLEKEQPSQVAFRVFARV